MNDYSEKWKHIAPHTHGLTSRREIQDKMHSEGVPPLTTEQAEALQADYEAILGERPYKKHGMPDRVQDFLKVPYRKRRLLPPGSAVSDREGLNEKLDALWFEGRGIERQLAPPFHRNGHGR